MSFGNVCVYPKLSFSEVFLLQILKSPHLVKNGCKPEPGWDKTEEERANEKAGYSFINSQLLKSLPEFNKTFLQYGFQVRKRAVGRCVQGAAERTLWSGVPSLHHQGPPQVHHAGHLADGDTGQVKLSQATIFHLDVSIRFAKHQQSQVAKVLLDGLYDGNSNLAQLRTRQHVMKKVDLTSWLFPLLLLLFLPWLIFKVWEKVTDNWQSFLAEPVQGEKQVGFNRFLKHQPTFLWKSHFWWTLYKYFLNLSQHHICIVE